MAAGQQQALAAPLLVPLRGMHRQITTGKGRGDFSIGSQDSAEVFQLIENIWKYSCCPDQSRARQDAFGPAPPSQGSNIAKPAIAWAIGRVGARVPVYGPLNSVVPVEVIEDWVRNLMELDDASPNAILAILQMARRTDDRSP